MKTILQNKHLRRNFLILIGALIVIIILIRVFVLPYYETPPPENTNQIITIIKDPLWITITSRILDSLFVSLTVTVGIGLFVFYIEIPDDEKKFEIIESFKLNELFEKERNHTEIWYFSGGLGRYTRSKTIPELSRISKNSNQHKTLKIQVIDPTNETVCNKYASYRNSLKSSNKNPNKWTKTYVRQEITSTIILAMLFKSTNPLLDLFICLKNNFSTLRIDLSSKTGIITKEDPKEPALVCRENSFLYRTYKEEILQTFKEYKSINTTLNFTYDFETLKVEDIEQIARLLEINDGLTNEDFSNIYNLIKENNNPYV